MSTYRVPDGQQSFELVIKRSRFITTITTTDGREEALAFIETIRGTHPDASHNCWAYIAGLPSDVFQIDKSDDGEPRGTAGKPMLHVLQHSGLAYTTAVVTRYFGGIKLGAGGLVRAYSQSVSNAISQLITKEQFVLAEVVVTMPYDLLDRVEHWLDSTAITITARDFGTSVTLTLGIPEDQLESASATLDDIGQGRTNWRPLINP